MKTIFLTPDIECGGCAASIDKALAQKPGIEHVSVDVLTKTVTVQFEEGRTNSAAIAQTLSDIGFPPQEG